MYSNYDHEWEIGPRSHATHALMLYDERVFQPFTQLEGSTTRTHGGMGLGLSIAQRTARSLGGDVTATSEIGRGSTFVMRVPILFVAPAAHESQAAAAA